MNSHVILEMLQDVADRVINPRFGSLDASQIDQKSHAHDLVTIADREAEVEIAAALGRIHPDAYVLGEEAYAADPGALPRFYDAEHAFTVDPIDGTLNFVNGSQDHAVMLAELVHGEVIRSWIWQPQRQVAFVAERGAGVMRNGELITGRPNGRNPAIVHLHTSYPHWHGTDLGDVGTFQPTWLCCGVDYPNLVTGEADLLVYRGTQMPWDHSPGWLMTHETGGSIGLWDGTPYRPNDPRPATEPIILVAAASPALLASATKQLEGWPAS